MLIFGSHSAVTLTSFTAFKEVGSFVYIHSFHKPMSDSDEGSDHLGVRISCVYKPARAATLIRVDGFYKPATL